MKLKKELRKKIGEGEIDGEIMKAFGNKSKDILYGIIKDCNEDGRLPEDFRRSVMIAIPNKTRTEKCDDHRTLSPVSNS
jgi:hypothetical protein